MSRRDPESGQATVEWVGLVLAVALVLGAVAAGGREAAKEESAAGLGQAVAERIACTARGACPAGRPRPAPHAARTPPASPPGPLPRRQAGLTDGLLKRTWLLCLGYRRLQYDHEHPRPPLEGVPLRDTARMVNDCVNPFSFLFG